MPPNLTRSRGCAIGALVLALGLPSGVAAQRLTPDFPTVQISLARASGPTSTGTALAFGHPDDYRWEGILVGGIGLGVFSAIGLTIFCAEMSEAHTNCAPAAVGGLLIGGTAGVVVGGLLGGLIPKAKP